MEDDDTFLSWARKAANNVREPSSLHFTSGSQRLSESASAPSLGITSRANSQSSRPLAFSTAASTLDETFHTRLWATDSASRAASPAGHNSLSRTHKGVMSATQRENLRAERYCKQLDLHDVAKVSTSGPREQGASQDRSDARAMSQSIKAVSDAFQEEVTSIDRQIEHMNKSIRLDHLLQSEEEEEAKHRAEREAERKRREAEMRRARMKEKMARDPHRKIQLRLENKRRFDMDAVKRGEGIPMYQFDLMGSKGREKVPLVDVRAIGAQCHGLVEGIHSVHELVEKQVRKERSKKQSSVSASRSSSAAKPHRPGNL